MAGATVGFAHLEFGRVGIAEPWRTRWTTTRCSRWPQIEPLWSTGGDGRSTSSWRLPKTLAGTPILLPPRRGGAGLADLIVDMLWSMRTGRRTTGWLTAPVPYGWSQSKAIGSPCETREIEMSSTMSSLDADLGRGDPTALRVLLIDASDRGGIARYTSKLREALVDQGTTVFLAAPVECGDTGLELPLHRWGPDVAKMSKMRLYRLRLAELGPSAYAFVRAVRRARPDIVHVQTEVVPRFDHLILRHLSRTVPVVLTAHGPLPDGGARELVIQDRKSVV